MECKVIRIVDSRTILLDIGESNGALVGEKFKVFSEGEEIDDPSTGRSLGKYEYTKAIVTLTRVFQKFSEAQLIEKEPFLSTPQTMKIKTLPIDETQTRPIATHFDPLIRVGDKARKLLPSSHILP